MNQRMKESRKGYQAGVTQATIKLEFAPPAAGPGGHAICWY